VRKRGVVSGVLKKRRDKERLEKKKTEETREAGKNEPPGMSGRRGVMKKVGGLTKKPSCKAAKLDVSNLNWDRTRCGAIGINHLSG